MARPVVLDQAQREALQQRQIACAPATRKPYSERFRMDGAPFPVSPKSASQGALLAELAAREQSLLACLASNEQLAFRMTPTGTGTNQLESVCRAARPEAAECVQRQLEITALQSPLTLTLARPERRDNPRAKTGGTVLVGGLEAMSECYRRLLPLHPDAEGMIVISLFIGADGAVTATDVLDNTTGLPELACCAERRLSELKFGPGDCEGVTLRIPFKLRQTIFDKQELQLP